MPDSAHELCSNANNLLFIAKIWNYVIMALGCLIVSAFCFYIFGFSINREGLAAPLIMFTAGSYALIAFIVCFIKSFMPAKILLSNHGIAVSTAFSNVFIPWERYVGIQGGPAILIRHYMTANSKRKSIVLGIFSENVEVKIFEFAKSINRDVPIRHEAYSQLPASSQLVLVIPFLVIAIFFAALAIYS